MVDSDTFTLMVAAPASAEALRTLRADAARALADGRRRLTVDLDGLTTLDSSVISSLIVILREARERGAEVRLAASRQAIVATLRVTGLDKVFGVAADVSSSRFPGKGSHGIAYLGAA